MKSRVSYFTFYLIALAGLFQVYSPPIEAQSYPPANVAPLEVPPGTRIVRLKIKEGLSKQIQLPLGTTKLDLYNADTLYPLKTEEKLLKEFIALEPVLTEELYADPDGNEMLLFGTYVETEYLYGLTKYGQILRIVYDEEYFDKAELITKSDALVDVYNGEVEFDIEELDAKPLITVKVRANGNIKIAEIKGKTLDKSIGIFSSIIMAPQLARSPGRPQINPDGNYPVSSRVIVSRGNGPPNKPPVFRPGSFNLLDVFKSKRKPPRPPGQVRPKPNPKPKATPPAARPPSKKPPTRKRPRPKPPVNPPVEPNLPDNDLTNLPDEFPTGVSSLIPDEYPPDEPPEVPPGEGTISL